MIRQLNELREKNVVKMPASNKRFGEIGVEVIAQILLRPLTVGDSPNSVQSSPNFAKPPGRCMQGVERTSRQKGIRKIY